MVQGLELQHRSPTVALYKKVWPLISSKEFSVLGSERGKRSSYEMNPLSSENHSTPVRVLSIFVLGSPSSKIYPAFLSDLIPSHSKLMYGNLWLGCICFSLAIHHSNLACISHFC